MDSFPYFWGMFFCYITFRVDNKWNMGHKQETTTKGTKVKNSNPIIEERTQQKYLAVLRWRQPIFISTIEVRYNLPRAKFCVLSSFFILHFSLLLLCLLWFDFLLWVFSTKFVIEPLLFIIATYHSEINLFEKCSINFDRICKLL